MISLDKTLDGPWEKVRFSLKQDLEAIETTFNVKWSKSFTKDGKLRLASSDVSGTLAVTSGGTGTGTAFTAGSVVFAGASGVYTQDNANFFWDSTLKRLQISTAAGSKYSNYNTKASRLFVGGPWAPGVFDVNFNDITGLNVQPTITATVPVGTAYLIGSYLAGSFVTAASGNYVVAGAFIDSPPVTLSGVSTADTISALYVENVYTPPVNVGNYAIFSGSGTNRFDGPMLFNKTVAHTRGVLTVAESSVTNTVTWSNAAAVFIYDDLSVTNNNSAAGSLLSRYRVNGTTVFSIGPAGELVAIGTVTLGAFAAGTNTISGSLNLGSGLISVSGPGVDSVGLQVSNGTFALSAGTRITSANSVINVLETWNAAGVTFVHEKHNITDTASAAHSILVRYQVSGADRFVVEKNGNVKITDRSGDTALVIDDNAASNATMIAFQYAASQFGTIENNGGTGFRFNAFSIPIEWLQSNVVKMTLDTTGRLGIGQGSPTAFLHMKAGTAAANTAPIKLTSGTVLTTPEAGTIEYDGTNFYLTP